MSNRAPTMRAQFEITAEIFRYFDLKYPNPNGGVRICMETTQQVDFRRL